MRPTTIVFFIIGIAAMIWLWSEEWDHNLPVEDIAPVTGCLKGTACVEPWTECVTHETQPDGLCSKSCALAKDCPGEWCCVDSKCMPYEVCAEGNRPL